MFREKGSWIKQIFGNKIISNCRKPSLKYIQYAQIGLKKLGKKASIVTFFILTLWLQTLKNQQLWQLAQLIFW